MQGIFKGDYDVLMAANGKVVGVTVTNDTLKISLRSVVSLNDYKALAKLGERPGCTFDARAKTTTIPLISKSAFQKTVVQGIPALTYTHRTQRSISQPIYFRESDWDRVMLIVLLSNEGANDLVNLVSRLGAPDAKTFGSVKDAMAAHPKKASKTKQRHEHDDDYAIPEVGIHEDADYDHE